MYNFNIIKNDIENIIKYIDISKFRKTNILITGANGLIGSFLADFFNYLNENYQTNVLMWLTSYNKSPERISHLIDKSRYFNWDCSKPFETKLLPYKLDYVFYCAGYGQPSKFIANPTKTALINTVGVSSILEHICNFNSSHNPSFLFLSSSEIYGDPEIVPTPENYSGIYNVENNRASYICSKRLGEIICLDYSKQINTKIARIALTYGPGVLKNDGRVLQNFIFKAHDNKQIEMLDSGDAIRNYLYLTDAIKMLFNILLTGKEKIYNVGGDIEPVSIYELASKVGSIFNVPVIRGESKSDIIKSAPQNVGVSMDRYKKEFKIDNIVQLDQGIENTVKWLGLK